MSEALSVSPAWLMGADVPMERQPDGYYLNSETARIAQEIKETPGQRILFDAAKDLSPEDIKVVMAVIEGLKAKEKR